jgi:ribonuclease HI
MYAAMKFLQSIIDNEIPASTLNIYTDCAYVIKGWLDRMHAYRGKHGRLWKRIWENIDTIREHDITIQFHKVKSHTGEAEIAAGIITRDQQIGNSLADEFARGGADIDEVAERQINLIRWIDATAWLVQKRLLKACELSLHYTKKEERPPPPPRSTMLDTLTALGHDIIVIGKQDHCQMCLTQWPKTDRKSMIDRGQCNPDMWGSAPPLCRDVPWVIPTSKNMIFRGKSVHASHHLAWYRGLLYCLRCGCYSEKRVRLLAESCKMMPSGAPAAKGLKRIKEGLHPISGTPQGFTYNGLPPAFVEAQADDRDLPCPPQPPGTGENQ